MRAIGYIRVSTEEQAKEGISLDNQEAKIKAYCESQDWKLVKVFSDEGLSGKDMKREGLKNLLFFLEADHVDVVVVYKTDRLTRKQRYLYQLLEDTFEEKGIGFKSVTEPFDTTTMGKGFLGMLGVFAQLEGDLISERTKDALQYKKEKGELVGSPPLGFEAIKNKLKKNDDELEIVTEIFKLNNNYRGKNKLSLREIAGKLNKAGFRTKKE